MILDFPKTYVDAGRSRFEAFERGLENLSAGLSGAKNDFITTGTTVVAFLSRDKKIGVIASDGRVCAGTHPYDQKFKKIFDCRLGYVGFAGALTLVQQLVPAYRVELDNICDVRGCMITASGALRRLFQYYLAISGRIPQAMGMIEMIPLFWDEARESCHLYQLQGMSRFSQEKSAAIGSGSAHLMHIMSAYEPADSETAMIEKARACLTIASAQDVATNKNMFCGVIKNGKFSEFEEEL